MKVYKKYINEVCEIEERENVVAIRYTYESQNGNGKPKKSKNSFFISKLAFDKTPVKTVDNFIGGSQIPYYVLRNKKDGLDKIRNYVQFKEEFWKYFCPDKKNDIFDSEIDSINYLNSEDFDPSEILCPNNYDYLIYRINDTKPLNTKFYCDYSTCGIDSEQFNLNKVLNILEKNKMCENPKIEPIPYYNIYENRTHQITFILNISDEIYNNIPKDFTKGNYLNYRNIPKIINPSCRFLTDENHVLYDLLNIKSCLKEKENY